MKKLEHTIEELKRLLKDESSIVFTDIRCDITGALFMKILDKDKLLVFVEKIKVK